MAESNDKKVPRKLPRPAAFGNRIKKEAARKAAAEKTAEPAVDLSKTSVPEFVAPALGAETAPEAETSEEGTGLFDGVMGILDAAEKRLAETGRLAKPASAEDKNKQKFSDLLEEPDKGPAEPAEAPSDEELSSVTLPGSEPADKPAITVIEDETSVPGTRVGAEAPDADWDTKTPVDGIDVAAVTSEKATETAPKRKGIVRHALDGLNVFKYFKGKHAEVLPTPNLKPDFRGLSGEGAPQEEAPVEGLEVVAAKTPAKPKKKSILSKIPLVSRIINYKSKAKRIEDDLRAQAAELGDGEGVLPEEPGVIFVEGEGEDAGITYVDTVVDEPVDDGIIFPEPEDLEAAVAADDAVPEPETVLEESAVEEPRYAGVTFDGKYAPILMFAAGEKAVVNAANRKMWEKTLEDLDLAYENAGEGKKQEAGDFRNYVFAIYASAKGAESKDTDILVYVLSELANAELDKGNHKHAFAYAKRANQVGEARLFENPSAEALHKWGMLEHNVEFYANKLETVEAE